MGGESLLGDTQLEAYGDLEISLHRRFSKAFTVETRFTPPGSQSEIRLGADKPIEIQLDDPDLTTSTARMDWVRYSEALTTAFFRPEAVKMAFGQAQARSGTSGLRLRLLFGPTAQELHRLHWETLRNPFDGTLIAANQKVLFSRYLAVASAQEVQLRSKSEIRALVAVSNPAGLAEYGLAPVDVIGETARARDSLKGMHVASLPSETNGCTLTDLVRSLQEGYDILYLTAHGSLARDQAWLWLEGENGQVQRVSGVELAAQLRLLNNPPMLIVLASCESAGNGEGDALQALGPQICEAGVPAVIAMQGQISMQSVAQGMPVFFENLRRDGLVDRALAAARATLTASNAQDLWMPALFMRLKDGSIWKRSKESAPVHVQRLWSTILAGFKGKPAAEDAVQELLADPNDPDNLDIFRLQLKKTLRVDPDFAGELVKIIETGKASQASGSGGVKINVKGNVGGSIVLGNNNIIGDTPKIE
jgi:hypothetical protein